MPTNQEIYSFASKWHGLFCDSNTTAQQLADNSFADECVALGFEMDGGKSFVNALHWQAALDDYNELDKIIDDITDVTILGSAVFSRWVYFTKGENLIEDIFTVENRLWFMIALGGLMTLTSYDDCSLVFRGNAQKLELLSNRLCSCKPLDCDDEIEQHLTIFADGKVLFNSYQYGDGVTYVKAQTKSFGIDHSKASRILRAAGDFFHNEHDPFFSSDIGHWEVTLTNENNEVFSSKGSLCPEFSDELNLLSDFIRLSFNMAEILAFDGKTQSDMVEKISVDYHRTKTTTADEIISDCSENLIIDAKNETLEYVRNAQNGDLVSQKFHVEDDIISLMREIDINTFFSDDGNAVSDVICNPLEKTQYRIAVDYLHGTQRVLSGSFNKIDLPSDFEKLVRKVTDFLYRHSNGEMFDAAIYNHLPRRKSDLIFCNVKFDKFGKKYCYLTDDESLKAGDYVVVPVGMENCETVLKIDSIEYHQPENAPYPIDKIKSVIRKSYSEELEDESYFDL